MILDKDVIIRNLDRDEAEAVYECAELKRDKVEGGFFKNKKRKFLRAKQNCEDIFRLKGIFFIVRSDMQDCVFDIVEAAECRRMFRKNDDRRIIAVVKGKAEAQMLCAEILYTVYSETGSMKIEGCLD